MPPTNNAPQNNVPQGSQQNPQQQQMLLSVLSYIGPLVIISYILAKDDQTVKFHMKQGIVLFVLEIIMMVASFMLMMSFIPMLIMIIQLGLFVLSIVGIINAVQGRQKELPLVGQFSKYVTF